MGHFHPSSTSMFAYPRESMNKIIRFQGSKPETMGDCFIGRSSTKRTGDFSATTAVVIFDIGLTGTGIRNTLVQGFEIGDCVTGIYLDVSG